MELRRRSPSPDVIVEATPIITIIAIPAINQLVKAIVRTSTTVFVNSYTVSTPSPSSVQTCIFSVQTSSSPFNLRLLRPTTDRIPTAQYPTAGEIVRTYTTTNFTSSFATTTPSSTSVPTNFISVQPPTSPSSSRLLRSFTDLKASDRDWRLLPRLLPN
ncbi:hypothetical protein PIB30_093933 [Stylosanthes scabra]|uniref:Uncharacterized protein n=1 Tax=Stylosanthes scabra TaxID=79078 RepID=A0ABU6YY12_9FABA|nr:hypothetical protein [Stylosanthes scabra]